MMVMGSFSMVHGDENCGSSCAHTMGTWIGWYCLRPLKKRTRRNCSALQSGNQGGVVELGLATGACLGQVFRWTQGNPE